MSDAWTPSTEQVRSHYVFDQGDRWDAERGESFDRWLAEHDREVAEKTWDEGRLYYGVGSEGPHPLNPYRKQTSTDIEEKP